MKRLLDLTLSALGFLALVAIPFVLIGNLLRTGVRSFTGSRASVATAFRSRS